MASIINATTTNGVSISADNSGILQLATNGGITAVTIDASQNVGIGTSSPSQKLDVTNGRIALTEAFDVRWISSGGTLRGSVAADSGSNLYFGTGSSNTERARIDSSGNLLVGTTSVPFFAGKLQVSGGAQDASGINVSGNFTGTHYVNTANTGWTPLKFWVNGTSNTVGTISVSTTATAYNTSSDYRLKNTIAPMTGALDKVALLKPCTYKWKVDGSDGQGFIAHELAEVEPGCVTGEKDAVDAEGKPQYQGIDTSFLVATLTAAIQEQQTLITQLQADVAALKSAQA